MTQYEGKNYYSATRLIKHFFQANSDRSFYHMVSFITEQQKDLEFLLLERPLSTIIPFYQNHALIIKPLKQEMESQVTFDQLLRKELEIRNNDMIYVSILHDIVDELNVKPKNQCVLATFPFSYVNDVIEQIILKRYYLGGKELSKEEMMQMIIDSWSHDKGSSISKL